MDVVSAAAAEPADMPPADMPAPTDSGDASPVVAEDVERATAAVPILLPKPAPPAAIQTQTVTFKIRLPVPDSQSLMSDGGMELGGLWGQWLSFVAGLRSLIFSLSDVQYWFILAPLLLLPGYITANHLLSKVPTECPRGAGQFGALAVVCGFDSWNPGYFGIVL